MKSREDAARDSARRQYQDMLAAAGVDEGRVALEILYLLPSEFVRTYTELFDMALRWNPSGANSGSQNSEGDVKAKGKPTRDLMNTRTIGVGGGGGKRWHERQWQVKSPEAMEEKQKLDKRLIRAAEDAIRAARQRISTSPDNEKGIPTDRKGKSDTRCGQCGRGQASGWVRCPFH